INNKPKYKIIRADDTYRFYISFTTLLKNFDREDLETLWRIVRDRFSTSKPTNFSDEYLLLTLKTMFGELDGQDAIWRNQKSVHGLALVKRWKLLTSCGVHAKVKAVQDDAAVAHAKHTSEGDRRAVRTYMRILSVVRIEVFSMYGYDYMKKIVLRRVDLNEHIILERDFKYLYPSDFKDLYLLNLQVIDSPRAVTFRDKYEVQMIMRFNEINKFSDGTLHQIDDALDYRVKEFKVNRMNSGLNTRFCTRKDVDRSKEFMFSIQKRLKTKRIFHNLERFVGGRVREGDYRLL
nr:hypothetical protein [Tanacetum cinerariifolium]